MSAVSGEVLELLMVRRPFFNENLVQKGKKTDEGSQYFREDFWQEGNALRLGRRRGMARREGERGVNAIRWVERWIAN